MVRQLLRYGIRLVYSLAIVVSGSLWLLACEGYIGGWWLGVPALRQISIVVLLTLTGIHFALDLFPMRWASRAMQGLIERYLPLPEITMAGNNRSTREKE